MSETFETIDAMTIYGDAIRTSNSRRNDVGRQWHRFVEEVDIRANTIYALYYNYESDFRGEFDFALGTTRDNGKPAHEILAGKYYVWDVGSEDPMDIPDAWEDIWASDIKRAYTTDFELYVPGESTKIYLAV